MCRGVYFYVPLPGFLSLFFQGCACIDVGSRVSSEYFPLGLFLEICISLLCSVGRTFLSSPLGETVLVWLFVALDYCGLSFGLFVGYLSGLLTRYVLPVWVIQCPAPSSFRHAYPRLGKESNLEGKGVIWES